MKQGIHPKYFHDVTVKCACGNEFTTGSVLPGPIPVEICAACHPFFTGDQKLVDTEGRVEKFKRRKKEARVAVEQKKKKKATHGEKVTPTRPKTLRDMLRETGK